MGITEAISIGQKAILMAITLSLPVLGTSLVVGLIVSILQTTTQISEQTLTFVPKMLAVFGALLFFGSWMLRVLSDFTVQLLNSLPGMIR